MTYDFFADKDDKIKILDFIFKETDLRIYDQDSAPEQEILEYKSIDDIVTKKDLVNGGKFAATFQLWSPKHKGKPAFRKIDLDPKHCNGFTFRYATEGAGLIQLYFGGLEKNELHQSHIGHFNERGALKWQDKNSPNSLVSDWDWSEIQATSRKLKYYIHNKLAVRKIGSFGVLPGADKSVQQGINLR